MSSRLVVLGSCGAWAEAGRACSGYVHPVVRTDRCTGDAEALEDGDPTAVAAAFDAHPLPSTAYRVGAFTLGSWPLLRYVLNAGVRLSAPGLTVGYT